MGVRRGQLAHQGLPPDRAGVKPGFAHGLPVSRRWILGWTGIAVLLTVGAVVAGLTLIGAHGREESPALSPQARLRAQREVGALLAGIPQEGDTLGRPSAPVTLEVFTDLECLTAKNWVTGLLPAIIRQFVRPGTLRIQFRSFQTDTLERKVFFSQQSSALAAGNQNRLWSFIETFYSEQGKEYTPYATAGFLAGIARQVPGLDLARWQRERRQTGLSERVFDDDQLVRSLAFHDTPAFMIGRTGGPMKKFIGRHIVMGFASNQRLPFPVTLIDTKDVRTAIEGLGA